MTNGTPPSRTIRSASDEVAEKPETSRAHTIQSASDDGATKPSRHEAGPSRDQSFRPFDAMVKQAGRDVLKPTMDRFPQPFGAGQNLTQTMAFGNVMASNYGAMCTEIVKHMHQAAQRQGEMVSDMLRARSPSDVLLAGNRYLLGGLQAFFDTNARIAQASAHTADAADQQRNRRTG